MAARLEADFLERARARMAEEELDGWLLYDLEGHNPVAAQILGIPQELSRRYFVLLPPAGDPIALTHGIEQQPWREWPWELRVYVGWEELESALDEMLAGRGRVAMEISRGDAVPFVDRVPAGVLELVEARGVDVASSASLISRCYARWSEEGRRLHLEAGEAIAAIAAGAFREAWTAVEGGAPLTEFELSEWVRNRLAAAGLVGGGAIVGAGPRSANPHYEPAAGGPGAERDDVLLVDLWGRVGGEPEAVFADQTWMGVLGEASPRGFDQAWEAVRSARDGVVEFIARAWEESGAPTGADADRCARRILREAGLGEFVLHRTGHAMDRVNHGFGPNLDSMETRDDRELVEGVGFSVEPGVYLPGRFGIRSEINVHMTSTGPEVTTPRPQAVPWRPGD